MELPKSLLCGTKNIAWRWTRLGDNISGTFVRFFPIIVFPPKASFQFAFKAGLVEDEGLYLEIIDARNKTTHVYSEEEIKKIYEFIKKKVVRAFDAAERKMGQSP